MPSLLDLLGIFLRIGASGFGGLGAALALLERELVQTRRVLTAADLTEALTYTKLLPGSTVLQVVAYVAYKLGGWTGSAVATVAFVVPSALAMLALAACYVAATALPAMTPVVNGLTAAVVGILLSTTYRLGKSNIRDPLTAVIAAGALALGVFFAAQAALVVIAAGLIGVLLLSEAPTGREKAGKAKA
jgi:chromate transporter